MILNQLQYRVTKARVQEFQAAKAQLEQDGIKGKALEVRRKALDSLIEELEPQLNAFENIKKQGIPKTLQHLEQLPEDLIKARIAAGLTQAELAKSLHLKPQQIQRYEATQYATASLARVMEVVRAIQSQQK